MMLNYIAEKNGNLIVVSDAITALNEDFILQNNDQKGNLLRLQAQINF